MEGLWEMHTDLMRHIIPEAEGLLRGTDEFYSFGFFVFVCLFSMDICIGSTRSKYYQTQDFTFSELSFGWLTKKYGNVIKWYFWRADTSPGRCFLEWLTTAVGAL